MDFIIEEQSKPINLSLKEQKTLWSVLNQAQYLGIRNLGDSLSRIGNNEYTQDVINDWLRQTSEEYDIINTLKAKLCGDLE